MLILIGDRILLTNLDFQLRNAKITRFWNRVKIEYMEQPIDTDSKMELEVLQAPWWAILLEGIIAIVIGLFLLYEPVVTTILLIQILAIFWLAGGIVSVIGSTSPTGSENHLASFRFQNTFLLNV